MNQKDILQEEALVAVGSQKYAGVDMGTGTGKTMLGLKHMTRLYNEGVLFLVVAPKSIHLEWVNQAQQNGFEFLIPHIQFTTYLSLYKQKHHFDYVYFDECHNAKSKHADWIRVYNGPVLGMTGTYPRYANSDAGMVASEFFPKVYTFNIKEGVENNILNNYKIYIHQLDLNKAKTIKTKSGYMSEQNSYDMYTRAVDNSKPAQSMMKRIMRMKAIQSFETKVTYAKALLNLQTDKTLLFADFTDQADRLCDHSYHSKNSESKKNLQMFKDGEITKLSSVLQIAEGANIPNLRVGIIMHAYANEKKLRQKIGRFLRLAPNDTAIIHILCYKNTVDKEWLKKALLDFEPSKIFNYDIRKTTHLVQ